MCQVLFCLAYIGCFIFFEASGEIFYNSFWVVLSFWSVSSPTTVSQSVRIKNINECQTSFSMPCCSKCSAVPQIRDHNLGYALISEQLVWGRRPQIILKFKATLHYDLIQRFAFLRNTWGKRVIKVIPASFLEMLLKISSKSLISILSRMYGSLLKRLMIGKMSFWIIENISSAILIFVCSSWEYFHHWSASFFLESLVLNSQLLYFNFLKSILRSLTLSISFGWMPNSAQHFPPYWLACIPIVNIKLSVSNV